MELPGHGAVQDWRILSSFEDFHEHLLLAIAYSGDSNLRGGINPYLADAAQAYGASWGIHYGESVLLLPGNRAYGQRWQVHTREKPAESRPWTPNEAAQYAALKKGEAFTLQHDGGRVYLTSALRNTAACQPCHSRPEDTLLGAYVVTFHEIADD